MKLRVALYQMDIAWCDADANLKKAEAYIRSVDADLIVLPETFTTGFNADPSSVAEDMDGKSVAWFRNTARETGKAVVGSVIIKDGERSVNRLFFAKPDGELIHYDKRHLFSFGGENDYLNRGKERVIVEYKGFRILPLICYDLRFPVWSRGRDEFDLMVYVASWDKIRINAWDALLKARAIENQSYLVGVNRVGSDPSSEYNGHSVALDYYGEVMTRADDDSECGVIVEFDLDKLRRYRDKFRAWADADEFNIIL